MCHSSKQRLFVKELKKYLPYQINVWIDEMEIVVGENITFSITKAIQECDFFIAVIDEYSLKSGWVQIEIELALKREEELGRIFFLPIVIDQNSWETVENEKIKSKKYLYCSDFNDSNIVSVANELISEIFSWLCREFDNRKSIHESKTINAEDFFYTLDEKVDSNFPELIKDAKSVSILARTAVNLLGQYERQFEELGKRNCSVKLLFISPKSEAVKYVYGSNPEIFDENIRKMNYHLSKLKQKNGHLFEARCINHAPTTSLILIEREENSYIVVQLYFLHSRISRDRPLFKVFSTDIWYNAFYDEFNLLWDGASNIPQQY